MSPLRRFSPYEQNQLHRFGQGHLSLPDSDQTPVEYLTHHAEFYHRDFFVDSSVLIPRLDSEKIIDLALDHLRTRFKPQQTIRLADVCTGSGCLGITLYLELQKLGFTDLQLTLSDLSSAALSVAAQNLDHHHLSQIVNLLESDLFQKYPSKAIFDLIVCNPPYIPSSRLSSLDASVKDYEPLLALDGGTQGTTVIDQLLRSLPLHTQSQSLALIEIDHTQKLTFFSIPPCYSGKILDDDQNHPRFLSLFHR